MSIHKDYTWQVECPACGDKREFGMKKADHEIYRDRFATREVGMVMATQETCRSCHTPIQIRKAMSTYGIMTVGLLDLAAGDGKVDMRYPAEFTPPRVGAISA